MFNYKSIFSEPLKRRCSLQVNLSSVATIGLWFAIALLSTGCASDDPDEGGIIGSGILLNGSVNESELASNGVVEVKSSDGELTELGVDSQSQFSATSLSGTGPWVLRVKFNAGRAVYAIAYADSTRNINRFSDLSLRQWFAQNTLDLDAEFSASGKFTKLPSASEYAETASSIFGLIEPILVSYGATAEGIISGAYVVRELGADDNSQGTNTFLKRNTVLLENQSFQFSITEPVTKTQSTTNSSVTLGSDLNDTFSVAPTQPKSIRALSSAADEIILIWAPSIDDVAVVAYQVIRNGQLVATTPYPVYIDSGLAAQQHSYEIIAIDAAGSQSKSSLAVLATPFQSDDNTPPPAPTVLTELETSDSSIHLLWAQPNIEDVVSFNLFRGSTPQTLVLLARVTSNDAIDSLVVTGQTYCYQVEAIDASGNISERSDLLCVRAGSPNPVDGGSGNDPLINWLVPEIESLNCDQTITLEQVLQGLTVIEAGCYSVPSTLILGPGSTLRIEAGAVLVFEQDAQINVSSSATLTTNGTADAPVVLTGSLSAPGAWGGIEFQGSLSAGNLIRGTVVQYAGGGNSLAGISATSGSSRLRIEDTLVRFNQKRAFHFGFDGTRIDTFSGNRITENESIGQFIFVLLPALGGNSDFSGNASTEIEVPFNFYTNVNITIPDLGVPLRWNGVSIQRGTLTIDPGVVLTMVQESAISVDGTFTAVGTPDNPIVMQGSTNSSLRNWAGLMLSGRGAKTFNHVTMSDAGDGGPPVTGAIEVSCSVENAATVNIDNVEISFSAGWGILIRDSGCDIQIGDNVTFFNNTVGNIKLP